MGGRFAMPFVTSPLLTMRIFLAKLMFERLVAAGRRYMTMHVWRSPGALQKRESSRV
jgi:hypothetical protein